MKRKGLILVAAIGVLAACDGFKEAMTAHVDVVARAGSQELSVPRLAELLGSSRFPLRKDVAKVVTDIWVDYQLLGHAAAADDSLGEQKLIDKAMWAQIANERVRKFYDQVSKGWTAPDSATEAAYNQGELLAARHILLVVPPQGLSTAAKDSIRRKAEQIQKEATPANFASLAEKYSQDPGSAKKGGYLGVFPRGVMVPEFEQAVLALKPGQISPVIKTQFGYHIIMRSPYADVKNDFAEAYKEHYQMSAESTFLAKVEQNGKVSVKPDAYAKVKEIAQDPKAHTEDDAVLATSSAGDLTASRFVQWIQAFPPQARVTQQLAMADSNSINGFVKNIVRNELLLKETDSAKVQLSPDEQKQLDDAYRGMIIEAWNGLQISPPSLADSGKTVAERERVAAGRIEDYLDRLLSGKAQLVDVPVPLETALRSKYDSKVNEAGLDRAVERATQIRATLDSTRQAQQPQSAVPMPGRPQMVVPGTTPPGAHPAPAKPQGKADGTKKP